MKLNNLLIKIQNKINIFFQKYFGKTPAFRWILLAICAATISTNFYYYIADRGLNVIISYIITTLVIFLLLSLVYLILQHLLVLFRRIKTKNLSVYIILLIVLYKIYDDAIYTIELDDKYIYAGLLLFFILVTIFAKSAISFFKNKKSSALLFLIPTTAIMFGILFFIAMSGFDTKEVFKLDTNRNKIASKTEKYGVEIFNYEGEDVNLLKYVTYSGNKKKIRDAYFKRGLDEAQISGRVYLPKEKNNSPVLFITHGNHRFTTENYLGYDYLGNYLAKRGFAVVSVDMNILNGFYKVGLSNENDARAILLLENIKYIIDQSRDDSSKLYKKLDKENIALMGHSRGGEACAIAYNYNNINQLPEDGNKNLNYGFNIKGIISVAPTYNQYSPGGKSLTLKDVNYFTVAGTNDADVSTFEGMLMYDNVYFSKDTNYFKTALYLGYANHGQFNSLWRDYDSDPFKGYLLNRKELLKEEEQQEILSIYTNDFLENCFDINFNRELFMQGPDEYSDLPSTNYYSRYSDSRTSNISNFEEDYVLQTASVINARISYDNLYKILEKNHKYGSGSSNTSSVFIASNKGGSYKIHLNEDKMLNSAKTINFDIENFSSTDISNNIILKMQDSWGNVSQINVSNYKKLTPSTKSYVYKSDFFTDDFTIRQTPQTVIIPIADFKAKNSNLNIDDLNLIEFYFDDNVDISIDNISFSK